MRLVFLSLACVLLAGCESQEPGAAIFHPAGGQALERVDLSRGELAVSGQVYIPVYSNVYWDNVETVTELSATVSIRNTDARRDLILTRVDYYGSRGQLIRGYLDGPVRVGPMGTVEWVIEEHDTEGGSGANFLVEWGAREPIARPVMEAIMLGQIAGRGISFASEGRPVEVVGP